jgi:hypothetical protein
MINKGVPGTPADPGIKSDRLFIIQPNPFDHKLPLKRAGQMKYDPVAAPAGAGAKEQEDDCAECLFHSWPKIMKKW